VEHWQLVITGCGTSHGTPVWGLPELWSEDPRDHRRRSGAILLGPGGEVVLIDAGPDLAHQLRDPYRDWDGLSYPARCITRCDGVLLTHCHADHIHGLNDLRQLNRLMGGAGIPIYGHAPHLIELQQQFQYCFVDDSPNTGGPHRPALTAQPLADDQQFRLAGLEVIPFAMSHGPAGRVTGYRIGNLGYCTDCKELPPSADQHLQGLELLVLDMLREEPFITHMGWLEALAVIERLCPHETLLVHMGHRERYRDWLPRLPPGVTMAYDGITRCFKPRFSAAIHDSSGGC
jgi:phosphoribosyl 1,2-cyclic phosphate phosphodiesterase